MSTDEASGAARRRTAREALNRSLFLDAAEALFADAGYDGASLRTIAKEAGFSTAAMYMFFETKAHLFAEVMLRRTDELRAEMAAVAAGTAPAITRLAAMADTVVSYYDRWPDFGRLVCRLYQTAPGASLSDHDAADNQIADLYRHFIDLEAGVIKDGQASNNIRDGNPHALAYLYTGIIHSYYAAALLEPTGFDSAHLHAILTAAFRRA
jgi:AcrR family transcriptional regulator